MTAFELSKAFLATQKLSQAIAFTSYLIRVYVSSHIRNGELKTLDFTS